MKALLLVLTVWTTQTFSQTLSDFTPKDYFFSTKGNDFLYTHDENEFTVDYTRVVFKTKDSISFLMYRVEYGTHGLFMARQIDSIKFSKTEVKTYSTFNESIATDKEETVEFSEPQTLFKMPTSITQKASWTYLEANGDADICTSEYSKLFYKGQNYDCIKVTKIIKPKGRTPILTHKLVDFYVVNLGLVKTVIDNGQTEKLFNYLWQINWNVQGD